MEGSLKGVEYYITPKWDKLLEAKVSGCVLYKCVWYICVCDIYVCVCVVYMCVCVCGIYACVWYICACGIYVCVLYMCVVCVCDLVWQLIKDDNSFLSFAMLLSSSVNYIICLDYIYLMHSSSRRIIPSN